MRDATTRGVLPWQGPWDPDPLGFDAGSPPIPPLVPDEGAPPPPTDHAPAASAPSGAIPASALALAARGQRPSTPAPPATVGSAVPPPAKTPSSQASSASTPSAKVASSQAPAKAAPARTTPIPPPLTGSATQQLRTLAQRHGVTVPPGADIANYQPAIVRAVVRSEARRLGIPERVALGLSGHESGGWKMWTNVAAGTLQRNANQVNGRVVSTDWGAMQINDRAHPKAFPLVQTSLEANVRYGLQYLKAQHGRYRGSLGHGMGEWDKTLAAYNLGHAPNTPAKHAIAQRYVRSVGQWADRGRQD